MADTVPIHFGVDADTALTAGRDKMRKFAEHLAEQNLELNRMSLFETDALKQNLLNYRSAPKATMEKLVDKARRKANKFLGGKVGDGLDAAHALDSVAGGYINKFIGLCDGWANQMVGSLWKKRQELIQPGKIHTLVPGVSTKDGFKSIDEFFDR